VTDASSLVSGNSYLIKYTSMTGTPYIYDAGTTTPLQAPSVQNAAPKSCAFYFISDASYATLYLPYDVTTTGSTKAYYIGTTNNGYAQLTETGSEGTEIPANTAVVLFNLAGQRVAQPSQRGVYIVGGKKVVVK